MKISPARVAAFDALMKIERDRAFSSVVLPGVEKDLSSQDASLCHELALGVLRREIYLDRLIDLLAGGKKLDDAVRISLRLGAYQLLFLGKIPSHASINESVELVQRAKKTSAKGFVNAILRRLQKESISLEFQNEIERIAVETSHPEWLLERWIEQFGIDNAAALAKANNRTPRLAFRRTAKGSAIDLSMFEVSKNVPGGYMAERMTPELSCLADENLIYFQDEGSQLVGEVVPVDARTKFLDVCAAPGGKTTQIASKMDPSTAMVVAGDLHRKRVEFLRTNCRNQGVGFVHPVQYDAEALPFADGAFDVVFVDAPCSGTGTIRHNPEVRYFLNPVDFAALSDKQLQILENASKLVRQGGTLIYSTCSLEREENEGVCGRFLRRHGGFVALEPNMPLKFATSAGFARTFPYHDAMDGFFVAVFGKR